MSRTVGLALAMAVAAFPLVGQPAEAQASPELGAINQTLREILQALREQVRSSEVRDESRMLLQRLQLQSDRLAPLEDTVAALRLQRSELEQRVALAVTQLEQVRRRRDRTDPDSLAGTMVEPEMRMLEQQREQAQEQLNALESRLLEVENEMLVERDRYDELAERIDARLEIDR